MTTFNRRAFLQTVAASGGACALSAHHWARAAGSNDRLRVASVGCGGKGWSDLTSVAASPKVEVVALCNIDSSAKHLGQAAEKFPQAKRYSDWRKLFDEAGTFDAVIVSTPDHMHAPISLPAMRLGKHVYCQKPLTHTVFEARQMRLVAKRAGVVTQMGNQIQSHSAYRTAVQWVHDGIIGKVSEVHSWQSGAMRWLLERDRPQGSQPVPSDVAWDLWLGSAPARPYLPNIYHPFNWRGWQDFGTGQLGDFGCHILDPVFMALALTSPRSVRSENAPMNREVWYNRSTVSYEFPGTQYTAGPTLPLTWYDGEGHKPDATALGLPSGTELPGAGSVLRGERGALVIPHVKAPQLYPVEKFADLKLPELGHVDHYVSWADACRGEGRTTSHFDFSGPLTETVLLGTVAVRVPGETLRWEAEAMQIPNSSTAQALLTKPYRPGWELGV